MAELTELQKQWPSEKVCTPLDHEATTAGVHPAWRCAKPTWHLRVDVAFVDLACATVFATGIDVQKK